MQTNPDEFVGFVDDGNEQTENDVDEESDERIQVELGEPPDGVVGIIGQHLERSKHVIAVDQREQALTRFRQRRKLLGKHTNCKLRNSG